MRRGVARVRDGHLRPALLPLPEVVQLRREPAMSPEQDDHYYGYDLKGLWYDFESAHPATARACQQLVDAVKAARPDDDKLGRWVESDGLRVAELLGLVPPVRCWDRPPSLDAVRAATDAALAAPVGVHVDVWELARAIEAAEHEHGDVAAAARTLTP